MSRKVKAQLASIRREASRIETQQMRAHVKAKRQELAQAEKAERDWTKDRKAERRARLRALREAIQALGAKSKSERRRRLTVIQEKRRQFVEWWKEVRIERARRLAEIATLRQQLKDWTKLGPERRRQSVAEVTDAAMRELATFDAQTASGLDALSKAIEKARRELKADEYDLRTWHANRGHEQKRMRVLKGGKREQAKELDSLIEANLETGEQLAWWKRNRPSILRQAKEMGIEAADGIAELVREQVEGDPDRAIEFLQDDADAWVAAELRKAGFAA